VKNLELWLVLILTVTTPASAAVDQSQLDGSDQGQAIHSLTSKGQTFEVGINGVLTGIELSLGSSPPSPSDLVIEIVDASGGVVDPPMLLETHIGEADLGPQVTMLDATMITATYIDLEGFGLEVAPGDELGVRLSTANALPGLFSLRVALADLYPGGFLFTNGVPHNVADAAFKTFVDTVRYPGEVDQYQLHGWDQARAIHSDFSVGQTFTGGRVGRLDGVELILGASGSDIDDLVVDVLDVTGGIVGAPVLGQVVLSPNDLGSLSGNLDLRAVTTTYVDLSDLGIWVQPGDLLAVRLSTTSVTPDWYTVRLALDDRYSGGAMFHDDLPEPTSDLAFKTFVATIFTDGLESGNADAWSAVVP